MSPGSKTVWSFFGVFSAFRDWCLLCCQRRVSSLLSMGHHHGHQPILLKIWWQPLHPKSLNPYSGIKTFNSNEQLAATQPQFGRLYVTRKQDSMNVSLASSLLLETGVFFVIRDVCLQCCLWVIIMATRQFYSSSGDSLYTPKSPNTCFGTKTINSN